MKKTNKGLLIAVTIIGLWGLSLTLLLMLDVAHINIALIPIAILCQTFLYTGLFITAHDAMHGSVCPTHRRINNVIGAIAVRLIRPVFIPQIIKKTLGTPPNTRERYRSRFSRRTPYRLLGVVFPFHERIPELEADSRYGDCISNYGVYFGNFHCQSYTVLGFSCPP